MIAEILGKRVTLSSCERVAGKPGPSARRRAEAAGYAVWVRMKPTAWFQACLAASTL